MNTLNPSLASSLRPTVLRVALAAALIPLTAALPAHAGPSDGQPRQSVVHYADLNLDSDAGTQVLYGRITGAARKVCTDIDSSYLRLNASRTCVADTIARAVLQVDSPRLTAMQAERS